MVARNLTIPDGCLKRLLASSSSDLNYEFSSPNQLQSNQISPSSTNNREDEHFVTEQRMQFLLEKLGLSFYFTLHSIDDSSDSTLIDSGNSNCDKLLYTSEPVSSTVSYFDVYDSLLN